MEHLLLMMKHGELLRNVNNNLTIDQSTSYFLLKDKSAVGMIVDYSRDYTVVNGV